MWQNKGIGLLPSKDSGHTGHRLGIHPVSSESFPVLLAGTCNKGYKLSSCSVMILSFWTDRSEQTVQTQIRLLL